MWVVEWPFWHPFLTSWAVVGGAGPVAPEGCSCSIVIQETVKEEVVADMRGQKKEPMG